MTLGLMFKIPVEKTAQKMMHRFDLCRGKKWSISLLSFVMNLCDTMMSLAVNQKGRWESSTRLQAT